MIKEMKPQGFKMVEQAFLKKWASDKKTLIQYGIIGGSILIFTVFFFLPILNQNQSLMTKIRALKTQIQAADTKIMRIPKMKEQKNLYEARTNSVEKLFFAHNETTKIIEIISTIAAASNVHITALSPDMEHGKIPSPFDQSYSAVSYKLVAEGGYHAIGAFINGIENFEKNMAINEFDLKRGTHDSGELELSFDLAAYAVAAASKPARMPVGQSQANPPAAHAGKT